MLKRIIPATLLCCAVGCALAEETPAPPSPARPADLGATAASAPAAASTPPETTQPETLQDKLSRIDDLLEPVEALLGLYYLEQKHFPPHPDAWSDIGLSTPAHWPAGIRSMSIAANSGKITVVLDQMGPGIDGTTVKSVPKVKDAARPKWTRRCSTKVAEVKKMLGC